MRGRRASDARIPARSDTAGEGTRPKSRGSSRRPAERCGSDADYPLPRHISDEDFEALAEVQRFTPREKEHVQQCLRWTIQRMNALMGAKKNVAKHKSPSELADMLEQMISLKRRERAKRGEIDREMGGALSDALYRSLLDVLTPELVKASPKFAQELARAKEEHVQTGWVYGDVEEVTVPRSITTSLCRDWYEELVRRQIEALENLLRRVKDSPRDKGGSPEHIWRTYLIRDLAGLYDALGRNPTATKTSKDPITNRGLFVDFVEGVFSAIGWPTAGIETAVCKYVPPFRDFRQMEMEKRRDDEWADLAAERGGREGDDDTDG
jgi:hypothetical protein